MAFVEILIKRDIFLLIKLSLFFIFIALNSTISLSVPALTDRRKFRFEMFVAKALAVIRSANLERVKAKSREGLMVFFCLFLAL